MGTLVAGFLATGCTPISLVLREHWTYSDLRSRDPIDTVQPESELLAFYSRLIGDEIQFRLDFLSVDPDQPIDLYILLDTEPGGNGKLPINSLYADNDHLWEFELYLASDGDSAVYDNAGKLVDEAGLSIYRDTFLDAIFISLQENTFLGDPSIYTVMVIATPTNTKNLRETPITYDVIGPIRSDAPTPPPLTVLLAFWDGFQSVTPAQALRSWDGAHTGSDSGRHGLRHLIDGVEKYHLPVLISGMDTQEASSAMDYMGIDERVGLLVRSGLLIRDVVLGCGGYGYTQYPIIDNTKSATTNGLSPSTIIEVLDSEIMAQGSPIILGGSLSGSSWGTPEATGHTMAYIAEHPWIHLLSGDDLRQSICPGELFYIEPQSDINYKILEQYNSIEPNRLRELAWSTYVMLTQKGSQNLELIRDNYIGQVGHILAAARWANSPTPLADCSTDLDWDGETECILASSHIFATFELTGGYLAFAFSINDNGPHQIIGPTYQLTIGLSDPSSWNVQNGLLADPAQILGAFTDSSDFMLDYSVEILAGELSLFMPDMAMRKTFKITSSAITIRMTVSDHATKLPIPFVLDPWLRYQPRWVNLYSVENMGDHWLLSTNDGISVQVYSSATLTVSSFLTPWKAMSFPEDPNTDYTPGYYLPFPMTLIEAVNADTETIELRLAP